MAPTRADIDTDFCWLPDVDLADETRLREIVAICEEILPDVRMHVSVLSAEQWQVALRRLLPARLRQNLAYHLHVLRDPRGPRRLLIGPSAVAALNEHSRPVTSEVAYAVAQAAFEKTPPLPARGSVDLCVQVLRDRLGEMIFCDNNPQDARLMSGVIDALRDELGATREEWMNELAARPASVMEVIRKSTFCRFWLVGMRNCGQAPDDLPETTSAGCAWLVEWLAGTDARSTSGPGTVCMDAIARWPRVRPGRADEAEEAA